MQRVMRIWFKWLIGVALLPLCVSVTVTAARLVRALPGTAESMSPLAAWFAGGFVFWVILYLTLPRPTWSYVLAHELTHAVWGLVMGARISQLRVSERGGSVRVSKTNVWITLAPYFFPLYTILTILLFVILRLFWRMDTYLPFWAGLVGLTWAFHLSFTFSMLRIRQPDVEEHGRLFSYTLIYVINMATILASFGFLTSGTWISLLQSATADTMEAYTFVGQWAGELVRRGLRMIDLSVSGQ